LWGDGLRKFERLAARPAFARERYDGRTFVIEEKSRFGLAVVHFKVCPVLRYQRCGIRSDKQQKDRLLLAMLDDMEEPGFDVWDTPNRLISRYAPSGRSEGFSNAQPHR
jgi:hypothetical protein